MKILQVLPALAAGGAEGFISNLSVHLAMQGVEVKFFLLAGVQDDRGKILLNRLSAKDIEIIGIEKRNVKSIKNVFKLRRLISDWKPDIVQVNLFPAQVITALAKILLPKKNSPIYSTRLANTVFANSKLRDLIFQKLDIMFDLRIACSGAVKNAFLKFMGDIENKNVVTIPNGGLLADEVRSVENQRLARKTLNLSLDGFVFAHIGSMVAGKFKNNSTDGLSSGQKAHDVIIKSFYKAFSGSKQHHLVLIGDGPLRTDVENIVSEFSLSDQVHFLGLQPEPWTGLHAADAFFFPSRYEGLPNVLPEAASLGLPIVGSDISEIVDISPGEAWILKPVNNIEAMAEGLKELYENYNHYSSKAMDTIPGIKERFSMESCTNKYLDAYRKILKSE